MRQESGEGGKEGGEIEGAGKYECDQADFLGVSFLPAMIH